MLVAALAAAATATIVGRDYAATQLGEASRFWSERLDRTTQAGARSLGQQVDAQVAALEQLADNASLRLYLWRTSAAARQTGARPAETEYLDRLLTARTDTGTRARAPAFSRLLLLTPGLQQVAGTSPEAPDAAQRRLAEQALNTRTRQMWLVGNAAQAPRVLHAVPVAPPPGAAGEAALAGVLLAETDAAAALRPVLANLPGYFDTDAALLVAGMPSTPAVLLAGTPSLSRIDAAPEAGFRQISLDGGTTALQNTRRVPGTDWTFVKRIDADLALGGVRQRIRARYLALGLGVVALGAALLAWRERSARVSERATQLPVMRHPARARANAGSDHPLFNKLVASLIDVIDLHDPYSAFHSARLAELCRAVADELGLDQQATRNLVTAALLANIGKLSLPRELLTKRDELSASEQQLLQSHVDEGVEILRRLDFDDPILHAIAQKQETLDGNGYPEGIRADRITLPGRILALGNAYVALVSPRAYRDALSSEAALGELRRNVGAAYDGEVFAALERVVHRGTDLTDWDFQAGAAG